MPKQRITKEMVVSAAFDLARAGGMEQVLVKNIADKLNCSVQPIYSYCDNMDNLRKEVTAKACIFIQNYLAAHLDKSDYFRSTGHCYVHLAKEEPHIFHMFILHEREGISSLADLYRSQTSPDVAPFIAASLPFAPEDSLKKAQDLHLHMLIYTVGIGTILATTKPGIPTEEVTMQLETACNAFSDYILQKDRRYTL